MASGGYDGSIKINTEINTKNVNSQMMSLENRIEKSSRKANKLKEELDKIGGSRVPTDEYKDFEYTLARDNAELEKLIQKQERFVGKKSGARWDALGAQIKEKTDDIRVQKLYMQSMRENETAYMSGKETDAYKNKQAQYRDELRNLDILNQKHSELVQKQIKAGETGEKSMKRISDSTKKSAVAMDAFTRRIFGLLKNVFIFSVITKALNAMRRALSEGLQEYAQYSAEYNKTMSDFKSSTATLGNAIVGAVAPLIMTALPYITKFVDFLTSAVNQVSKLISALTGKSTWSRAVTQNVDYASSLGKTAKTAKTASDNVKELTKTLAGYDKLNNITTNKDSGSGSVGSGASKGALWEEVPLTEKDMKWINKIKEALKTILPIVTAIGVALLGWKIASFLSGLMQVNPLLGKILSWISLIAGLALEAWSYFDMWNNGINWVNLIANLAGTAFAFAGIFALFGKKGAGVYLLIDGLIKIVTALKDIKENGLNMKNSIMIAMGMLEVFGGFLLTFGAKYIAGFVAQGASMGATFGITLVSAIMSAVIGFQLGKKINEWLTGEKVELSFAQMMDEIFSSLTDGTFKDAMRLWAIDIKNGLSAIWQDLVAWARNVKQTIRDSFSFDGIKTIRTANSVTYSGSWKDRIPHMANGGITTGATIAQIGEAGREAVLPLENNTGWMDALADRLSRSIKVEVIPIPDESGIFKSVQMGSVEYVNRTGRKAF